MLVMNSKQRKELVQTIMDAAEATEKNFEEPHHRHRHRGSASNPKDAETPELSELSFSSRKDPSTGKTFYINNRTKETLWDLPPGAKIEERHGHHRHHHHRGGNNAGEDSGNAAGMSKVGDETDTLNGRRAEAAEGVRDGGDGVLDMLAKAHEQSPHDRRRAEAAEGGPESTPLSSENTTPGQDAPDPALEIDIEEDLNRPDGWV
jgi:hypothetical protein